MKEKLTDEDILLYIADFIDQNEYSPTIRELCKETGLKSTATIKAHLDRLKRDGYIDFEIGKARTTKIKN